MRRRKQMKLRWISSLLCVIGVLGGFYSLVLAQETPGVTKDTIKIGLIGPITGAGSLWGDLVDSGAIAMYQEINEKGGVHGRKIEVIHEDDKCSPETGLSAVKKLLYQDKVFMLQAFVCSLAGLAAKQDIIDAKVPWMINAATADAISKPVNRYVFQPALTAGMDGEQAVKFIMTKPGAKRIAIVSHKDAWAEPRVNAARRTLKDDYNLTFIAEEEMSRGSTDATVQVLKIKQAKPDTVILHLYPAESAMFIRDAHRNGLEATFMGSTATTDLIDFVKRVGTPKAAQYMYAPAQEIDSPDSR
jgi:branched-chain amino acid transport system substrate-binding protein